MTSPTGDTISIDDGDLSVTIAPEAGGRIAQISIRGVDLLIGPGDGPAVPAPISWGLYPMVPWAGRIRHGRFRFGHRIVDLPRANGPHAIHGVGYTSPWEVVDADGISVELRLDLPTDLRWPFGGYSRQRIAIEDGAIVLDLDVTADHEAFPATIGWHPWFRKPDSMVFEPSAMYRRDATGIAVDELTEVSSPPWDDCFRNDRPVRLEIDGIALELTSPCDHWVVFSEPPHATCVEPQTGPPDAPTIRPAVVAPGETLAARFRIAAQP